VDLNIPPYARDEEYNIKLKHVLADAPIHILLDDLRLVMRLPGKNNDVIVDCMDIPAESTEIKEKDDIYEEKPRERFVYGTNIKIETQEPSDQPLRSTYYPADTFRDAVDSKTYIPSLDFAPFPYSVLKEFRNPFGRSNKRLPAKYVARLRLKDAREEIREAAAKELMLDTPAKELQRSIMEQVREQRPEVFSSNERHLTEASIDKLAEYMAKHFHTGATLPTPEDHDGLQRSKPKKTKQDISMGKKRNPPVKFSTKPKNDGWKATKGKMATKAQKLVSNKTFERLPLRLRRKKPLDKRYDMRSRK
jgi:hypothetical protein